MAGGWIGSAEMEALFAEGPAQAKGAGIVTMRTRQTAAGSALDVEIYPVWNTQAQSAYRRESLLDRHREAVRQCNARRRQDHIRHLAQANFVPGRDLFVTLTYAGDTARGMEDVKADVRAFLRRARAWRQRRKMDPLKYLWVIEKRTRKRTHMEVYHAHMFLSAMDRDAAEGMWPHGFCNTRKLQDDGQELLGRISAYVCKGLDGWDAYERAWGKSRSLAEPEVRERDRKIGKAAVAKAMRQAGSGEWDPAELQEIVEAKYPGYRCVRIEARASRYATGVYIRARMRKRDEGAGGGPCPPVRTE